jgi:hypothetical protein
MTEAQFLAAINRAQTDWNTYIQQANDFSSRRTDCVGKTIDQYNRERAKPGAQIRIECRKAIYQPPPIYR